MSEHSELLKRLRADYDAGEPDTLETEAADAIAALLQERATLVEALAEKGRREVASVWRCCVGDTTAALDMVARKLGESRRKAEREKGSLIEALSEMIWSLRSPAPTSYKDADEAGKRLHTLVRAYLMEKSS